MRLSQLEAFSRRSICIWFFTECCALWEKSIMYWVCDHFGNSLNLLRNLIINYLLAAVEFTRAAGRNFCVFREMSNIVDTLELYIWVWNCHSYARELLLSRYVIAPQIPYSSFSKYSWKKKVYVFRQSWRTTGFSEANNWCSNSESHIDLYSTD